MISVFTPTYNRRHLLPRLYESLQQQKCRNFEWIVVDDGSTDDTAQLIRNYADTAFFPIVYFYQENSGKHVAHNRGVQLASGELFFCLDSDDWLANNNTVSEILNTWEVCRDNPEYAGIISYKKDKDGCILGAEFPEGLVKTTPVELNTKYYCGGERTIIYRTLLLKANYYPYFEGEKFCPDSYISDRLSRNYKFYLRHYADEICEYQSDGLSRGFRKLMAHNSKAFALCNMELIDMESSIINQLKRSMYYWGFLFYKYDKTIKYRGRHRITVGLAMIPGVILSVYYRIYRLKGL